MDKCVVLWLQDDENLERWESTEKGKTLTASDRRILIAHWFYNATRSWR